VNSKRRWASLLPLISITNFAHAELPLWEAGLGIGGASFPEYRGSDEEQQYVLPIPYFVYRGERLNVDRRGIRGLLLAGDNVALNVSADLGIPVDSDQNGARAGMPDLDLVGHLGPSLEFTLHEASDHANVFKLKFPIQSVIGLDLSEPGTHGWFSFPHINYILRARWTLGTALGVTWGSRSYHRYYYGIGDAYATPARPAYSAKAGYSGARASMSLSRRVRKVWLGVFARYENLSGAVYEDSPLVRQSYSLVTGFGVSWVFAQSSRAAVDSPLSEPDPM
jgi:outer membrane scaffolding protein for murein synthesis (MipA/OmpV family)